MSPILPGPPNLRPNSKEMVNKLNSKRLFGVLEKCNLMNKFDQLEALKYLNKCREDCNRVIKVKIFIIFIFYFYFFIFQYYKSFIFYFNFEDNFCDAIYFYIFILF